MQAMHNIHNQVKIELVSQKSVENGYKIKMKKFE